MAGSCASAESDVAVGAVAGVLVGLLCGISPFIARVLDPYQVTLNSIPRVALIPLFVLWIGIGLWVFAGLRMSVPFALIGAVIAEMFTSNEGLGYLISVSANQYDAAGSSAALFVTTMLGLLLIVAISQLERRALLWRPSSP